MGNETITKVRVTITNDQGEVYVGPARVLVDARNRLWVEDDEGDLSTPDEILRDAWGWAGHEEDKE